MMVQCRRGAAAGAAAAAANAVGAAADACCARACPPNKLAWKWGILDGAAGSGAGKVTGQPHQLLAVQLASCGKLVAAIFRNGKNCWKNHLRYS